MQYEISKLERMTLDEVREIAISQGMKVKKNETKQKQLHWKKQK